MHVIELLGPPASGKSTLAAALAATGPTAIVKRHGPRDAVALAASVRGSAATLLLPRPPGVGAGRQAAWITRLGAAPAVARRCARDGAELVVFDQGPAYTLGRLSYLCLAPSGSPWWGRQALRTAALIDLVVLLEGNPDLLGARLRGRAKAHPGQRMSDADLRAYLRREQERCRVIAQVLARAGTRVQLLDTAGTRSSAGAQRILATLAASSSETRAG